MLVFIIMCVVSVGVFEVSVYICRLCIFIILLWLYSVVCIVVMFMFLGMFFSSMLIVLCISIQVCGSIYSLISIVRIGLIGFQLVYWISSVFRIIVIELSILVQIFRQVFFILRFLLLLVCSRCIEIRLMIRLNVVIISMLVEVIFCGVWNCLIVLYRMQLVIMNSMLLLIIVFSVFSCVQLQVCLVLGGCWLSCMVISVIISVRVLVVMCVVLDSSVRLLVQKVFVILISRKVVVNLSVYYNGFLWWILLGR